MNARLFTFAGGEIGPWQVVRLAAVRGEALDAVPRLDVVAGASAATVDGAGWRLRGVTSNERYVTRAEKDRLLAIQPPLGRPGATCAALIPIRKNEAWWGLTQDERRRIFEDRSKHGDTGLGYLPAVARRLHHCRDLGDGAPFDFLTWFEYAPADAEAFEELVGRLRATEEWAYVEREVDIRVRRE